MSDWLDREAPEWFPVKYGSPRDRECREAFGAWLRLARRQLGWSQASVGAFIGVHQSTISRLESGRILYLRFRTGIRLLLVILEALVVPRPPSVPAVARAWPGFMH